ncbi:PQQ-binding-like beta-propeller repeat protein [Bacillus carboniphilus]|uniref:PQQ-binding-like beta-propeller repeat protein n=1 Tax=Bacillus carboniphilus TaxID=86663 RepID=A0ABN0VRL5_9BACI
MKKWTLMLVTGFILLMPIQSVIAAEIGPTEWTQYRMNSENNPVYNSDFNEEIRLNLPTNDEIRSTPVIVGNRAYVGNHNTGGLFSFDLESGELLWENKAPNWIHSEMIYAEGQLFVGYGNRFFQDDGTRGTGESGMLSLDPETGDILWDFQTKGEVMPTPAYDNGTVYITTGDRHLYAIDPKSGKEKWSLNLDSRVSMSSPNIKDGVLYVGGADPYAFYAVDLEEREIKWQQVFDQVTSGLDDVPAVIFNDQLVITTGVESDEKHNHKIYAMDITTGDIVWEDSLGMGAMVDNNKSGAPIIYEDKVFVGSPITQKFYSYNAESGEKEWEYKSHVNKAPPVAENGVVYFTDTKGIVYGFDTESGELLGQKTLGGKLAPSGPVLMNGHLIVGSQDSNVYVLPVKDILSNENEELTNEQGVETNKWLLYGIPGLAVIGLLAFFMMRRKK